MSWRRSASRTLSFGRRSGSQPAATTRLTRLHARARSSAGLWIGYGASRLPSCDPDVFSETLLDHFQAPRNVGELAGADAEAEDENPVCGDRLHVWLRVQHGRVNQIRWRAEGCAPAIAAASVMSELVSGMTLDAASRLSREAIADALGGLPARKSHAAVLAVSTLRAALSAYARRSNMP